jgi:hypothetical protein
MNDIVCGSCEDALSTTGGWADLILTDPPYVDEEWGGAYSLLSKVASHVLKPSGFLITYAPHIHLDKIMDMLGRELDWYWLFIQLITGPTIRVWSKNVTAQFKPILVYQKPPFKKSPNYLYDCLSVGTREKRYHKWEQPLAEAIYLIENFTTEGGVVYDPFSGSGTTLLAAKLLELQYYGHEVDSITWKSAALRLEQTPLISERVRRVVGLKVRKHDGTKQKKLKEMGDA